MTFVSHVSCPQCGATYGSEGVHNLCEACSGPLLVDYDLDRVRGAVTKEAVAQRAASMWRYRELLPVRDESHVVTLGEGFTPLIPLSERLLLKDEGLNPTGTFKARGASCGISRARELGIKEVALPTAGNAGGAWACYGAAAGIRVHVAMPSDAPEANKLECLYYGADLELVDGLISDAAALVTRGIAEHGWFDAATLKEPYRIEGKKTLGFEIAEQLGWEMPDAIIYPAGGGVGIIGIWRALLQLRDIDWVTGDLPRLIVVQAAGCAPLVKAFDEGAEVSEFWPRAETIAAGLRVPKALGDFLVLRAMRETGGVAVSATDSEILGAMLHLAKGGISAAPEGAATLVAYENLVQAGVLTSRDRVVIINTGSAQKYPDAMRAALR
ncbi:MAG: threonine synthase [Actinomycetota bacterium]|nr:threonine synthase [Actinomycetota bacterium]